MLFDSRISSDALQLAFGETQADQGVSGAAGRTGLDKNRRDMQKSAHGGICCK